MNPKKLLWGIIPLLLVPLVSAVNILDMILRPFGQFNVGQIYLQYFSFIDACIYLILFLSLAQFVFKKMYEGREGKMVSLAVGLALAFAMAVFELRTGFNLSKLGPFAALIFFLILVMLLFNVLKGLFNEAKPALCFTILIMYGLLVSAFGVLAKWIEQHVPLLFGLIHIALLAAFICALMSVIGLFKGDGAEKGPKGPSGDKGPKGDETKKPPPGSNAVTLINPAPGSKHPQGKAIPIVFHVDGPQLNPPAKFDYDIVLDSKVHYAEAKASGEDVNTRKDIPDNLSVGPHKIFVNTYPPGTTKNMARTGEQVFYIEKEVKNCKVEITAPVTSHQTGRFTYGQTIIFNFKTTNIKVPFVYTWKIINSKDNSVAGGENKKTSGSADRTYRNINMKPYIMYNTLLKGEYLVHVEVHDSDTGQNFEDAIKIIIGGGSSINAIQITSPVNNKDDYLAGQVIPIKFTVAGPNHAVGKPFKAAIFIRPLNNPPQVKEIRFEDNCTGLNHIGSQPVPTTYPPGKYEVWVITYIDRNNTLARARSVFEIKNTKGKIIPITTTTKTTSPTSNVPVQIINPTNGQTIDKNKGFILEYVTNHPSTYNYAVSFPSNGGIIKEKKNIYNNGKPFKIKITKSDMKNVKIGNNLKLRFDVLNFNGTADPKYMSTITVNVK
jgi:hypothetical protein